MNYVNNQKEDAEEFEEEEIIETKWLSVLYIKFRQTFNFYIFCLLYNFYLIHSKYVLSWFSSKHIFKYLLIN